MADDNQNNVIAFTRTDNKGKWIVVLCNFSPVSREGYQFGVPARGEYQVVFSSDEPEFGGDGLAPKGVLKTQDQGMHGQEQSLTVTVPPMSAMILECTRKTPKRAAKAPAGEGEAKKKAPAKRAAAKTSSTAGKAEKTTEKDVKKP